MEIVAGTLMTIPELKMLNLFNNKKNNIYKDKIVIIIIKWSIITMNNNSRKKIIGVEPQLQVNLNLKYSL